MYIKSQKNISDILTTLSSVGTYFDIFFIYNILIIISYRLVLSCVFKDMISITEQYPISIYRKLNVPNRNSLPIKMT